LAYAKLPTGTVYTVVKVVEARDTLPNTPLAMS